MKKNKYIKETPWDSLVLGVNTYEIMKLSKNILEDALMFHGHFTIKVRPGIGTKLLYEYGFYYCDTLIQPYCTPDNFKYFSNKKAGISYDLRISDILSISREAFYGRFHRDFNIERKVADARYDAWLTHLYKENNVFGLLFNGKLTGFFAFSENRILLHALSQRYRGKGLGKYLWSVACKELFSKRYKEITSSISASNMPILNLYASLGFKFRNPVDVYHKLVK